MTTHFHLSIPSPCHQEWENFTPSDNGRFCSSCQKTVVDFTTMTDQEIVDFFTKRTTNTCARFRREQLERYATHQPPRVQIGLTLLKASLLILMMMLISEHSFSQQANAQSTTQSAPEVAIARAEKITPEHQVKISGIVKDENGQVMPGVNVVQQGTANGTSTDANGNFSLSLDLTQGKVLLFSFVGYHTVEHTLSTDSTQHLDIVIDMAYVELMGAVAVHELYEPKQNLWSRVKKLF